MSRRMLAAGVCLLAVAVLGLPTGASAQPRYRVVELGTLGGPSSTATAVNAAGDVTGTADLPSVAGDGSQDRHAFLWRTGSMADLGASGPVADILCSCSFGLAIDAADDVAGSDIFDETSEATLWQSGSFTHVAEGSVNGLNDAGTAVGSAGVLPEDPQPFVLHGHRLVLITYPGLRTGSALDINDAGTVVGELLVSGQTAFSGFVRSGRTVQLLPAGTSARAISNAGTIVGVRTTGRGLASHGFVAGSDLVVHDLGTLGGLDSQANAVNSAGVIVGWADTATASQHAFVRTGRRLLDLNKLIPSSLGLELIDAGGINDLGEIAATAVPRGGGPGQAVLLVPA